MPFIRFQVVTIPASPPRTVPPCVAVYSPVAPTAARNVLRFGPIDARGVDRGSVTDRMLPPPSVRHRSVLSGLT